MSSLSLACSRCLTGQYVSICLLIDDSFMKSCSLVLIYTLTLLICSLIGRSRNNRIWARSVKEASFFSHLPAAPTALPPGARMRIEGPSPPPSILRYKSLQDLRKEFQRMNNYLLHRPRTPDHSSPSRPSDPESALIAEIPRFEAEVPPPPEKTRLKDSDLVDYWDPEM